MKICRFDGTRIGVVQADRVHDVTRVLDELPPLRYPVPHGDHLIRHLESMRGRLAELTRNADAIPVENVRFNSPVANPSKIIGTPSNYLAHRQEAREDAEIAQYLHGKRRSVQEQGLFLKANSSLVGASEGVTVRMPDRRTDHEAELGVVIGRTVSRVPVAEALSCVAGYAIALDMVIRGKEDRSFRKSPDSYSVLGPWLVTADEVGDPGDLDFSLAINDDTRQAANTSEMIVDVPHQIAWASQFYTLHPGDIIMTGTCGGVGPVVAGDLMMLQFERIGRMEVPITESTQ